MPIYEYACGECGNQFELLVLPSGDQASPACPACRSQTVERLISGFAVSSADITGARVVARRRELAQSKDRKDQRVADAERIKAHSHDH